MGEIRNAYNIQLVKPEGKRSLGRYRCRWEDNIKIDLEKYYVRVRIGSIWLKIGSSGWLLRTR
jgi:hypothetical protein